MCRCVSVFICISICIGIYTYFLEHPHMILHRTTSPPSNQPTTRMPHIYLTCALSHTTPVSPQAFLFRNLRKGLASIVANCLFAVEGCRMDRCVHVRTVWLGREGILKWLFLVLSEALIRANISAVPLSTVQCPFPPILPRTQLVQAIVAQVKKSKVKSMLELASVRLRLASHASIFVFSHTLYTSALYEHAYLRACMCDASLFPLHNATIDMSLHA